MDIDALSHTATTILVPLLPYLMKAGERVAEDTGEKVSEETWKWAKRLWNRLLPGIEGQPKLLEAAKDAATTPNDRRAGDVLCSELTHLLAENEPLAQDILRLLQEASKAKAFRERSVSIGGDLKGGVVITGDHNTVR
jgi:hypothetical protein